MKEQCQWSNHIHKKNKQNGWIVSVEGRFHWSRWHKHLGSQLISWTRKNDKKFFFFFLFSFARVAKSFFFCFFSSKNYHRELSRFIANGKLSSKIDKTLGLVESQRPDNRNATYQTIIKQGDTLLNRVQKLSRVINI